jgi:pyridoxal biosynthesis lyase PdxS
VPVCANIDQPIDEHHVTFVSGKRESALAEIVRRIDIGAAGYENSADSGVAGNGGKHQERPRKLIRQIRIEAGLERSRQRRDVASFDAVMSFFERHGSERYGGSVTGAPSNPDPYELRHIRF